jgi:UDP:flavonoid glycosyltransferase YjiC (YdhE family)
LLLVSEDSKVRGDLRNGIGVFNYAPYSVVMPRASVIVHQAGIGTTGQALQAGRPMLIVPYGQDQPDNGRRCVELGVAEMLPRRNYNLATALEKLERLLRDPSYAENARNVAVQLRREDGTKTACDVIEGVLNDVAVGHASQNRRAPVAFRRLAYGAV